ncbi:MAG: hypothetical protein P8Y18_10925 [Candidatus Bathyarchaeota archaeon]
MSSKTSTIIDRIVVNASPFEVYDAFMNSKKHSEFTGSKATGTPKEGAEFSAWDGYISVRQGWLDFYWKPLKEYFKKQKSIISKK